MAKAPWNAFFNTGLTVLAVLLLSGAPVRADQNRQIATVYAVGSSSIRGSDMSAGRKEAIDDSLVVAVTQVLTELMSPETMEGQFQVISESILPRTDQFIADYKMLTEATHASTHHVMVRATVSVRRLKDALKQSGIYLGKKKYPKILYCIAEKQIGDAGYDYWWSGQSPRRTGVATAVIAKAAEEKGFQLVVPKAVQSMSSYPPELSVPEAVTLGLQQQADVVVIGQAVGEEMPNTMGASTRSFRGTVAAWAYTVRNGKQIGETRHTAVVTGDDPIAGGAEAINNASVSAGEELAARIAAAWFSNEAVGSKVVIHIEGISGHIADFVKLRGAMGEMSGVDSVQRKEMQSDTAVLIVDYQGSAGALAEALMRLSFDTFGLNIAKPEGNTIRLQIVPR